MESSPFLDLLVQTLQTTYSFSRRKIMMKKRKTKKSKSIKKIHMELLRQIILPIRLKKRLLRLITKLVRQLTLKVILKKLSR